MMGATLMHEYYAAGDGRPPSALRLLQRAALKWRLSAI